jgi:hypothetical protein
MPGGHLTGTAGWPPAPLEAQVPQHEEDRVRVIIEPGVNITLPPGLANPLHVPRIDDGIRDLSALMEELGFLSEPDP